MPTDRRDFLRLTAAATGGLGLGVSPESLVADSFRKPEPPAQRAIRILILGGTGFIGPHQVRYALDRGHTVTLFNRGRTNTHLFPGVERLVGDRNGQLDALAGRSWDVVIDNSRSNPEWVRLAADFLKDSVGLYFYVSSRSAYSDTSIVPMTADAPTYTYESAGVSRDSESLPYGLAKALSEREAQRIFVGRANIVFNFSPHGVFRLTAPFGMALLAAGLLTLGLAVAAPFSITRVSVDSSGAEGNERSCCTSSINGGGRYVAFSSRASNLVAGDTNAASDIFVRNRLTAATERVSVDSGAAEGNGGSFVPSISTDGRYVAAREGRAR